MNIEKTRDFGTTGFKIELENMDDLSIKNNMISYAISLTSIFIYF